MTVLLFCGLLAGGRTAAAQGAVSAWHEARSNTARTGTSELRWGMTHPSLDFRVQRNTPVVNADAAGARVIELEVNDRAPMDVIGLTDRGLAAFDGATGRRLWPTEPSEFFPLLSIVGIGDLNGDRQSEIVGIGRDNVVAIYERNGRRRWALPSNLLSSLFQGEVRIIQLYTDSPALALLVSRSDGAASEVTIYRFDQQFAPEVLNTTRWPTMGTTSQPLYAVGEFDGDNVMDVLGFRVDSMGVRVAPLYAVDGSTRWPAAANASTLQTPTCSCMPSNLSLRVEVFRSETGRDRVAFKRLCSLNNDATCAGVIAPDLPVFPQPLWHTSVSDFDNSLCHFVDDVVAEMPAVSELVIERGPSGIVALSTVDGTRRGDALGPDPVNTRLPGLELTSIVRLSPDSTATVLGTALISGAKQLFRWNGTVIERSPLFDSVSVPTTARLDIGFNRYRFSQPTRREAIVTGRDGDRAVLGHANDFSLRALRFDRLEAVVGAAATVAVAHRAAPGAFVVTLSFRPAIAALRRLNRDGQADGAALVGGPQEVHPLLAVTNTSNTTTGAHVELRSIRADTSGRQLLLSPSRGAILDPLDFNAFESIPAFVPGTCANPDERGINPTASLDGTVVYLASSEPSTGFGLTRYSSATRRCTPVVQSDLRALGVSGAVSQLLPNFFEAPVSGAAPSTTAVFGYGVGVTGPGSVRDVTPLSLSPTINVGASSQTFSVSAANTNPIPLATRVGPAPGVPVALLFQGGSGGGARNALVTFFESPIRSVSIPVGNAIASMHPIVPIAVPASNGDALIINNASASAAHARPTLWRFTLTPTPAFSLVGVGPQDSTVEPVAGVAVRCGTANAGRYRYIFKQRVSAMGEDARFEALEFASNPSAIALPASAGAWAAQPEENLRTQWRLCFDHPNNDCDTPIASVKFSRVTYGNLSAVQNDGDPVVLFARSDGQLIALGHVCGPTAANPTSQPQILWNYPVGRSITAISATDRQGDGVAEISVLSSDGMYNVLSEEECSALEDPRCPIERPICDVASRRCVQCNTVVDCERLVGGICAPERHVCDACGGTNSSCARSGGTCISTTHGSFINTTCACATTADCNTGYSCLGADEAQQRAGQCVAVCTAALGNCPSGFSCESTAGSVFGRCVPGCLNDAQCLARSPSRPVCAPANATAPRACVECTSSAQCAATRSDTPVCVANRCVQCSLQLPNACEANVAGAICLPTLHCGCLSQQDCRPELQCNLATGRCGTPPSAPARFTDTTCACRAPGHSSRSRPYTGSLLLVLLALLQARSSRSRRDQRGIWAHAQKSLTQSGRGRFVATVAFTVWLCATHANAQAPASTAPAPDAQATSAQPQSPVSQPTQQTAHIPIQCGQPAAIELFNDARDRFEAGQNALIEGRATDAERALREAASIYESPNTLLLLARALRALRRFDEAYDSIETTMQIATRCSIQDVTERGRARYARTLEQAALERSQLAAEVALMSLRFAGDIPAATTVSIDDRAPVPVLRDRYYAATPGAHELTLRAPRHLPFSAHVELAIGRVATVEITMQPVVEQARVIERVVSRPMVRVRRSSPLFAAAIVGGSTAAVATAVGVGLWLNARDRYAVLESACSADQCPMDASFVAAVDRAERAEIAGRVMVIGATTALAGSVVLLIVGLPRTEWVAAPAARAMVVPTQNGLQVQGIF